MIKLYPRIELTNKYQLKDAYKVIGAINSIISSVPDEFNITDGVSFMFTDWTNVNDTYYGLLALVDLHDKCLTCVRVVDGYYDDNDDTITVGDGFMDIKYDETSINMAIQDIIDGTIPLINRVNIKDIDVEKYPYVKL